MGHFNNMRIAYITSFLLFSPILSKFIDYEEATSFLRVKRETNEFKRDESNECFVENQKCSYEDFAEKAENEFHKRVFGRKNWRKKRVHINEVTFEFFVDNYKECGPAELTNGCKTRMIGYLTCSRDSGRDRQCFESHKKVEGPMTQKKCTQNSSKSGCFIRSGVF